MSDPLPQTVTAHDFDGKTHQVETSKLSWRPSAYGIVIKDGKILLLKQTNGYDLPGGGVELGETTEQAVLREIKEETGIDANNPRLLALTTSYYLPIPNKEIYKQSIMIYYVCDFVGGELSTDGFDEHEQIYAEAPEWLPLEALPSIKLGTSVDYREYVKQVVGDAYPRH